MILLRSLSIPAFKHLRQVELSFPRGGSILIEGPNESGKSTLFEAIYFALYGTPLVADEGHHALTALLPHGGESAAVALSLLAEATTLEIQRSVTRQSARRAASPAASQGQTGHADLRHVARLVIRRPGAPTEEIVGVGPVNDRVLAELHGLDGDTLRNSCFMEQGALDRVEALSRSAREDAIATLLGLERLVGIERDLRPTQDDHAELERARIELAVAERSREATDSATREAEAAVALRAARVRALLAQRDSLAAQHADHEQAGQTMRERSSELEGHIARAGQVAALLATVEATEPEFAAGREAETTAGQHRARLEELDRIERETLPATEARLAELRTLEAELAAAEEARSTLQRAQQLQRVAELDSRLAQLDQLMPALSAHETAQRELVVMQEAHRLARAEEAARAAMAEHQAAFTHADGDARVAQQAVDQANLRDILAYWVRLKEIEALKRGEHEIAEITVRRDALSAKAMRLHNREVVASLLAMVGALIALATAFGGFHYNDYRYWIGTAVAVVLVWLFGIVFFFSWIGSRRSEGKLREIERRLTLASIRSEAANLLGGSIDDLPQVEADLMSAGASVPETIESGRAQLASLTAAEPASLADLEDHAREVLLRAERCRVDLTNAQAQLEAAQRERGARGLLSEASAAEIERRLATAERNAAGAEVAARGLVVEPFAWPVERAVVQATNAELAAQRAQAASGLGIGGDELIMLESAQRAVQDAQARLDSQISSTQSRLAALGLPADPTTVSAARGGGESEVGRMRDQLRERETLAAEHALGVERAERARTTLSPAVRQAWQAAAGLALLAPDAQPADHTDLTTIAHDRAAVQLAATTTLDQLDERSRRDELAGIRAQLAVHGDRGAALTDSRGTAERQVAVLLAEQGVGGQGDEPVEQLAQAWPMLAQVGPDEVEPREQTLAEASREAHFARRTADELARTHGFDAAHLAALSETECRRRVEDAERILRQRELATSMARDVRTRIVRRVLPETEGFMRTLLPALTLGRYRDVRLLRDEANASGADLHMRVWDQMAGGYVSKSLFSGGAQDQCSLALRLAFALATLPKELGATPGFIFLDEPLSSFDSERSQALVQVVTEGLIGQQFPQVFLISHRHAFDPASFRYTLRMEDGAVAVSTLPGPHEAAQQWDGVAVAARARATNA